MPCAARKHFAGPSLVGSCRAVLLRSVGGQPVLIGLVLLQNFQLPPELSALQANAAGDESLAAGPRRLSFRSPIQHAEALNLLCTPRARCEAGTITPESFSASQVRCRTLCRLVLMRASLRITTAWWTRPDVTSLSKPFSSYSHYSSAGSERTHECAA